MVITKTLDTFDSTKKLAGHSFTSGWLLNSLRENDKLYSQLFGNRLVKDITAFDVSGGKGFLSIVLRCTVFFVDSVNDTDDVYTTILKIPGFDSFKNDFLTDQLRTIFTEFHKSECDFYNILAPILDGPTPTVFKTVEWILDESEGCIHMEDLTMRGRTMTYFETVNLAQIKCLIQHLAHMHKNILCSDTKIWKEKHLKSSTGFIEVLDMMNESVEVLLKKCDFEGKSLK
uniref:Uncharacterized protein n=1 Tax=Panagrolaimus superbus TaxID=310955 RepID=A0A914YN34_9BILA